MICPCAVGWHVFLELPAVEPFIRDGIVHEVAYQCTGPLGGPPAKFEAGAKFRDWRTSVRIRTFGAFVRHYP